MIPGKEAIEARVVPCTVDNRYVGGRLDISNYAHVTLYRDGDREVACRFLKEGGQCHAPIQFKNSDSPKGTCFLLAPQSISLSKERQ